MTHDQCVAALKEAESLVDRANSACSQTIAAFEKDGPFLVDKAQERLRTYCLPENHHEESLIKQAQEIEAEIERWLPHRGQFDPLRTYVSETMGSALAALMNVTRKRIKALPTNTTIVTDTEDLIAQLSQVREVFGRIDAGDENAIEDFPTAKELEDTSGKMDKIKMDHAKALDFLDAMAECGFLAGAQVAATYQTIAGYIDSRNAYLMTYLKATDYFRESGDAKKHITLRTGAIQAVSDAITTAVGQYAPLILPKLFTQVPLVGGGFAILDVARTMNEKRKSVEERRSHLLELAKARQERNATDEMVWLGGRLNDDGDALVALVTSTVEMCDGLMTLADSLRGAGS